MKRPAMLIRLAIVGSVLVGAGVAIAPRLLSSNTDPRLPPSPSVENPNSPDPLPSVDPETETENNDSDNDPAESNAPDPLANFPRQPLSVGDTVPPGSDFAQFRQLLRQAVSDRNADVVRPLIPSTGLPIGYGRPQTAADLDLDNSDAWFWDMMDKSLRLGCDPTENADFDPAVVVSELWICPNLTQRFYAQYPPPANTTGVEYELDVVMVLGENVNVRSLPSTDSPVIAQLSNEWVQADRTASNTFFEQASEAEIEARGDMLTGWTAVILPNQQSGYVSNEFVYSVLGPRIVFGKVDGEWQMMQVLAGD